MSKVEEGGKEADGDQNQRRLLPEILRSLRRGRGTILVIGSGDNEIGGRREMSRYGLDVGRPTSWGLGSVGRLGSVRWKARAKR
ncbi:hypothetical protein BHE74_00058272 [Ensete ventricosum]|nr:hypothetical protein BHE74_00058272 [Ensete ventricosum]RZS24006.1 hypothetical protein BHM03_00057026 [Ensete ventricosum]